MSPITIVLSVFLGPMAVSVFDFESVDPGRFPEGWSIAMTYTGDAPEWQVREDPSAPSGSQVLVQVSNDARSGRFPLAVQDAALIGDGALRVEFKALSGRIDQAAGLVFRYVDENNYYVVRANALEDNVVMYKIEDGRRSALMPIGRPGAYGVDHTVPDLEWNTLGVRFEGPLFTVSLNDEELFQVEDLTFAEAGRVGLWTKADSVMAFDDFEVTVP